MTITNDRIIIGERDIDIWILHIFSDIMNKKNIFDKKIHIC